MNSATTPLLKSRLICMVYEAMLLFGVLFLSTLFLLPLLQNQHILHLRQVLQYSLFIVVGIYFVWFWMHGGQTLAMKTWHIKLVTKDGHSITIGRGTYRYLLSWLWFAPGLALAAIIGAKTWMLLLIPALNMFIFGLAVYLDPQRQFLHDRMAGTRLIRVVS